MTTPPSLLARQACLCNTVRRADRLLNRVYDDALRPSGLLTTQYALLSALGRAAAPLAHSALAEQQAMSPTTLSRNLKPLQRDGLVQVAPGEDRRARYVSITPVGRAALQRALPLWRQVQAQMRQEAGDAHVDLLLAELNALVTRLRERLPEGEQHA